MTTKHQPATPLWSEAEEWEAARTAVAAYGLSTGGIGIQFIRMRRDRARLVEALRELCEDLGASDDAQNYGAWERGNALLRELGEE